MFITICGKSSSGKSTLRKELGKKYKVIKTYTTRPPRDNIEKEKGDYNFISKEEFDNKSMLLVRKFRGGWLYGVDKQDLDTDSDAIKIIILDPKGISQLAVYTKEEIIPVYVYSDFRTRWIRYRERVGHLSFEQWRRFFQDLIDFKNVTYKLEEVTGNFCLRLRSERVDYMRKKVELFLQRLFSLEEV